MLKINVLGYFSTIFTLPWLNVLVLSLANRNMNLKVVPLNFAYILHTFLVRFTAILTFFIDFSEKIRIKQNPLKPRFNTV